MILYLRLDAGSVPTSSTGGDTTVHGIVTLCDSLSVLPGLAARECWARLTDVFTDSFIQ